MKLLLSTLFFVVAILKGASCQLNRCRVVEEASKTEKVCKFPFTFKGQISTGCTSEADANNRSWCSTRTDKNGNHVGGGGFWGYCEDSTCRVEDKEQQNKNSAVAKEIDETLKSLSVRGRNNLLSACPCLAYKSCPMLTNLFSLGNQLERIHPTRRKLVATLKDLRCEDVNRGFRCCELHEPEEEEDTVKVRSETNNKDSGTWQPKVGECGIRTTSGNIIGGNASIPGEFPFMALIGYDFKGRILYTCGGTLINKFYVLTAAHCIRENGPKIAEIIFGEHDLGLKEDCDSRGSCAPPIQRRFPTDIKYHPEWDPDSFTEGNDIALIRLDKPVTLLVDDSSSSQVAPVCLPWKDTDPGPNVRANTKTTVIGWGKITNSVQESRKSYLEFSAASRILNKLQLRIRSRESCAIHYKSFNFKNQLCSGGEIGKDSCSGDSGGPLLFRNDGSESPWFQVGIVSYGTKTCGIGKPGVYTKVSPYMDWIKSELRP